MSDTVIKVENISKQYRLGMVGTGTFSHDLNRWWHSVRGKENPYLQVGDTNDRSIIGKSDYIWSLKDINFEVKRGEVLGIIGKNGAGKSTLLKILSRVTQPTTGTIYAKGRIASLLEVGTGFHPELSGRENIFLNGSILGMTKSEIKSKFDEIVDFSGIGRYIDTPVKRYSSGMYVRLAFAVAAHLEPEILIVDEVLAVGDAEFQKKCLGKMKDVSGQGRTVLFVSHNMNAISALCTRAIFLQFGKIKCNGDVLTVLNNYMISESKSLSVREWAESDSPGDDSAKLLHVSLLGEDKKTAEYFLLDGRKYGVKFIYKILKPIAKPIPQIHLYSNKQENVFISYGYYNQTDYYNSEHILSPGLYESVVWFNTPIFNAQVYQVGVGLANIARTKLHFWEETAITFEVIEDIDKRKTIYKGPIGGIVRPDLDWENIKLQ